MGSPKETQGGQPRIFISFAPDDAAVAELIQGALRDAEFEVGLSYWFDQRNEPRPAPDFTTAPTVAVLLLSPSAVRSRWISKEIDFALEPELDRRGIDLIPAIVERCEVPPSLERRAIIDLTDGLRSGIERLIAHIRRVEDVDLTSLPPMQFENLVGDLLLDLGFDVEQAARGRDPGYDFRARYSDRDPFGAEVNQSWIVAVKSYRRARMSVRAIHELMGVMNIIRSSEGDTNALLVTSGHLTSIARAALNERQARSRTHVRVLDGTELKHLVLKRPSLLTKYFGQPTSAPGDSAPES